MPGHHCSWGCVLTTNAEYLLVSNEYAQIDGVLRSQPGRQSPTVLLDSHPRTISAWNLNSWPCLDLPPFGIDTFGFNNRFTNSPAGTEVVTTWEEYALDVAAAVAAMRDRGYKNVILYGLSAGGPLMSYYQNVAENGNSVFGNGQALSGFKGFFADDGKERRPPPADAVIFQNSTIGTGNSFIIRLDASILDEDEVARDPDLDLFNPA